MSVSPMISTVKSATDNVTRNIGVEVVLQAIRTGGKKLNGQITQIRNRFEAELAITGGDLELAKRSVEKLKKALPGVMWCGQFFSRKMPAADKLQKHLYELIADGLIRSVALRRRNHKRGIRLIHLPSLRKFIAECDRDQNGPAK